jgi:integrase/recombinase XerC
MAPVAYHDRLTFAELAVIMRAAVKDQSYRATPVGTTVGRYIRWLRNEWGATPSTVRDYEAILARMSIALADRELIEVSTEDLREVIDLWAMQSARTRQKITSVIRAFWGWCEEQMLVAVNPAARIRRPRAERRVAKVLPLAARPQLLEEIRTPRDRLALYCLLIRGVRRNELAGIQFRHFDTERKQLVVFGKGQKERILPLPPLMLAELKLALSADLPHVGRPPEPDDYLVYPTDRRACGKGSEGQIQWRLSGRPKDRASGKVVHVWWYHQLQAAGLVGQGVTSGLNMHQARHAFAIELRRVAGIEGASQALGHTDLSTTLGVYGHQDQKDLERAMELYNQWLADGNL